MKFPKLEAALQQYMTDKETTAAALDWLDISKERDMELFEKLTLQPELLEKADKINLFDAIEDDILPHNSDELIKRYMLLSYKLLDAESCYMMIHLTRNDIYYISKMKDDAFAEVYGDEAQARLFSVNYCNLIRVNCIEYLKDTGMTLEAAELTSDKLVHTKLMLCANALSFMTVPENGELSDEAKRAVSIIRGIMESDIAEDDVYLLTALAAATHFDKELKVHFEKYAAENAMEISSTIDKYINKQAPAAETLFSVDGILNEKLLDHINGFMLRGRKQIEVARKMQPGFFEERERTGNILKHIAKLRMDRKNGIITVGDDEFKSMIRENITEALLASFKERREEIEAFIADKLTFNELYPLIKSIKLKGFIMERSTDYIKDYGCDDFIMRCVAVIGSCIGRYGDHLNDITGFSKDGIPSLIDWFYSHDTDMAQVLDICSNISENSYYCEYMIKIYADALSDRTDDIAAADISKCSVLAKTLALTLLGTNDVKYRKSIMSLAGDSSKAIRELVADIAVKHPEWKDDIKVLLGSKKSSARVAALDIIERQGASAYKDELKKALAAEKTDKLKARIGSMLAVVSESAVVEEKVSAADLVKEMTKGKKTSKLDWLFKEPFFTVRKKDGTAADESYIKALMLCFANSVGIKDPNADIITAELDEKDVTRLANEVLTKWLSTPPDVKSDWMQFFEEYSGLDTLGAQAKYKWVLYFASVYGGKEALEVFESLMSTWPLYQKGALAKEIPHAIVLNGSSSYIMMVEKMSRKHRFNSIRKASADALLCASEKLGISKEEFADRMIPDLDFDKDMCRIFDYGSRQFKVYISQKLEPEIYCDGKKLKTMPKPNTSDGKQAAEVYKEFTAMKKLMKTVVAAQRVRLENTLLTARTWTTENWKQIFMENPIMHCFATGLIWGIYKDGKLEKSFRYLEDGSLTNVDDEEFTLADDAVIGLVHPVELSKDEPYKWKQQLNDYEIDQPIVQLDRCVYRPTEEEKGQDFIGRFKGNVVKSTELASAMNRIGWSKGQVGDGAIFDDFTKEDIFDRNDGIRASLRHSGIPAEIYRGEVTDVTVDKLVFETLPKQEYIKIGDLSDRYFSEIMYQLRKVFTE